MDKLIELYESKSWGEELRRLQASGELVKFLPEVAILYGIPQPAQWHPEICTGWHMELCLNVLQNLPIKASFVEFCSVLFHDLGKGLTAQKKYPSHHGHEGAGVPLVEKVCERMNLSQDVLLHSVFVCRRHLQVHTFLEITDKKQVEICNEVLSQGLNPEVIARACYADASGRLGLNKPWSDYPQGEFFIQLAQALEKHPVTADKQTELVAWADQHMVQLKLARQLKKEFKDV